jgi:predicted MPP superfamily phosphohydrolase
MSGPRSKRRHTFLKFIGALIVLISALGVYARFIEPKLLIVREFTVETDQWTGAPLTIAVLSDTHVGGKHVHAARVARIMKRVDTLKPDLILLAGDYIAGHEPIAEHDAGSVAYMSAGLSNLGLAHARYGTFSVLGNHDWWYDEKTVRETLRQAGIIVLENELATIEINGTDVQIIGIGDDTTGHAAAAEAILDWQPDLPTFTFTHNPDVYVGMPKFSTINFAGHTHGGQIWVPFLGRPNVPSRYGQRFARGRYEDDPGIVLVTSGIGTSSVPIRFLTPPEIMLVTVVGNAE